MVATSYNGYPVITNYGDPMLVRLSANGKPFAPANGVRKGPVAIILNTLANWLDNNIEPMDPTQSWSFTPKTVTGGSGWSCHASGTAFDYNAQKHGQGVRGTWAAEQIRRVDAYLRDVLKGAVRWGEHYNTPTKIDGMHFEVMKDEPYLSKVIAGWATIETSSTHQEIPVPVVPAVSNEEDDMLRLASFNDDPVKVWLIDFGQHTKWHVPNIVQLKWLLNIGVKSLDGVQDAAVQFGYREI